MNDIILPIGTVCTLKGANKKIMITAFFIAEDSNPDELYDYCGCLWPEGMIDSENHFLFNKDKIEKVHHIGFSNEEEKEFKDKLYKIIKEKNNNKLKMTFDENEINDNEDKEIKEELNTVENSTRDDNNIQTSKTIFTTLNLNDLNNNQ